MDIAYDYDESRRFRVNIFMSRGKVSYACRLITSEIKRFDDLHVPDLLGDVALAANGLILFAGVTGSGRLSIGSGPLRAAAAAIGSNGLLCTTASTRCCSVALTGVAL